MTAANSSCIVSIVEQFDGKLADRLEEEEPSTLGLPYEALVDKRRDRVEARLRHDLGSFELEAAGEHTEPREDVLLVLGQQFVAPLDRAAQRALSLRSVACASCEHVEAASESFEDLFSRQHL